MYSRSSRKFQDKVNPDLGPGCYTANNRMTPTGKTLGEDGYAPFSTLSARVSMFDENSNVSPAPGSYEPALGCCRSVTSSLWGRSTAARFLERAIETPGPGSHDIGGTVGKKLGTTELVTTPLKPKIDALVEDIGQSLQIKNDSGSKRTENMHIEPHRNNEMSLNAVRELVRKGYFPTRSETGHGITWKRKFLPPSIPVGTTANGYQETNGELVPRQMPKHKSASISPYDIQTSFTERSKHDKKGFKFSCGKRSTLNVVSDSPAPTVYNVIQAEHYMHNGNISSVLIANTSCQRITDSIISESLKQNLPGPGAYSVKSYSDEAQSRSIVTYKLQSNTKSIKLLTPGPGSYEADSELRKKLMNIKYSAFGAKANRFDKTDERRAGVLPAPGNYDINDTLVERIKKRAEIGGATNAPFGSVSLRNTNSAAIEAPGPGQYELKSSFERRASLVDQSKSKQPMRLYLGYIDPDKVHTPVFGGAAPRFSSPDSQVDSPAVGDYDIAEAFQRLKQKGKIPITSGLQTGSRRTMFAAEQTPAPNEYTLDHKSVVMQTAESRPFLSTQSRFMADPAEMIIGPGPGAYGHQPSLIKKTFNATLSTWNNKKTSSASTSALAAVATN